MAQLRQDFAEFEERQTVIVVSRFVHYGHDMTDIPKIAENLEMIDALNAEGPAATHMNQGGR